MGYFKDGPLSKVQKELNKEFFSGSQASLFIGDIWVDDVAEYQYQMSYSAKPIYGYGSTLYDYVAEGRQLVQGSFTINFREPNYLWAILERNKFNKTTDKRSGSPIKEKNVSSSSLGQTEASFLRDKRVNLDYFFNSKNPNEVTKALVEERDFLKTNANTEEVDFKNGTFDIVLGYGSELNEDSPGEKILGVKLVGKAKVIYHNGNPIMEQYNFFARNVI